MQMPLKRQRQLGRYLKIEEIRKFQDNVARRFDESFIASEIDAVQFERLSGGHLPIVIPNGVDLGYFQNPYSERPIGNAILFTGHMSSEPNIDAVVYFSREILPMIIAGIPDVRFYIVGKEPAANVSALAKENPNTSK